MLKTEDIEIHVGRADASRGDFIKIVYKPTGICRGKGPPLVKVGKLKREMLSEIEAELIARNLTQYIVVNRRRGIEKDDRVWEYRRQLREAYGELYSATEALFFLHDPMRISFEDNTEEYDPEVASVLPPPRMRFRNRRSANPFRGVHSPVRRRWASRFVCPNRNRPLEIVE